MGTKPVRRTNYHSKGVGRHIGCLIEMLKMTEVSNASLLGAWHSGKRARPLVRGVVGLIFRQVLINFVWKTAHDKSPLNFN